jgi:hypothetical protein
MSVDLLGVRHSHWLKPLVPMNRLLGNYAYRLSEYCPGTAEVLAGTSRVLERVLRLFLPVLFSAIEYLS